MSRINIVQQSTAYDEDTGPLLVGWFDPERAERFEAATRWDGNNMVDINTGKFNHQILYRTASGRWVLHEWSQWQGSTPSYEFVDDERAQEWLLRNDEDAAVERYFGPVEEERGPGRPEIGPAFSVRLGDELTTRLDVEAKRRGLTRAAMLRELVATSLPA